MRATDEQINAAIDLLRKNGYSVTKPEGDFHWETPGEFRTRLKISTAHFARRIAEAGCPAFSADISPTGRILRLSGNPDFEAWFLPRKAGNPNNRISLRAAYTPSEMLSRVMNHAEAVP